MRFEWDEIKNHINKIKHGVSFEEARTVFMDENAVVLYDEYHSADEDRFIVIGVDLLFRELTVCHCFRGMNDEVIRIISARKATSSEIKTYWRGW